VCRSPEVDALHRSVDFVGDLVTVIIVSNAVLETFRGSFGIGITRLDMLESTRRSELLLVIDGAALVNWAEMEQ
jgi:hypothetical protein